MPHYTNDGVFLRSNRGDWNPAPAPATDAELARQQRRAEAMCAARAWYEEALAHAFAVGLSDVCADVAALVTPTAPVFNADDSITRSWSVYVRFDGVAPTSPVDGEYAGVIPGDEVPSLRQVEACVEAWLSGCERPRLTNP